MGDHPLDDVRKGRAAVSDTPPLPEWARRFEDARPAAVNDWIARWSAMSGANFPLVEFDVLAYIRRVESQLPGVMVEDGDA